MENNTDHSMTMACIILAAGSGTRMKSTISKVLFPFLEKPLLEHVLEKAEALIPGKIVIVCSPKDYQQIVSQYGSRALITVQENPLGTGDAVKVGLQVIGDFQHCMILCGDTPLLTQSTLTEFFESYMKSKSSAGFISALVPDPKMYGRVYRGENKQFKGIVEFKDASEEIRQIREINSGIYLFEKKALTVALESLHNHNQSGEYYFTDTLLTIQNQGNNIFIMPIEGEEEILGINHKLDLSKAIKLAYLKIAERLMVEEGVIIIDPSTTFIGPKVSIGKDSVILPFCYLEGEVRVGTNTRIGPYVCMRGTDASIDIGDDCIVGPFSSIRGGSKLEDGSHLGTFVECKKTHLGESSKAMHLSYLGDAEIGENVNVGAGTITCNYDGYKKHKTIIEDNVFLGSDTIIVAPLTIKKGSYTGAGSVITEDVPEDSLALGRAKQMNKEGWCRKMREARNRK